MNNSVPHIPIGRLLRSTTVGFTFGCSVPEPEVPLFGDFVKAPAQHGQSEVIGLISDILIEDDPFVRQLIAAPDLPEAYIQDQRKNRQVPIEVSVLTIGYRRNNAVFQELPPQPPMTLDYIQRCEPEEIATFTGSHDYFALIINTPDTSADELLPAALQRAAKARPADERRFFMLQAGKELARLLANDLPRLNTLLRRIQVIP
ncbi:MAG: hypothetical protein MK000_03675 [Anaerolineales bacterium]|nr:hypothetical protein [Anaerolineales bacterium]